MTVENNLYQKPAYVLGSVDKVLQLLQLLRDTGSIRLLDAAHELDVSPSTAHRLLSMLVYRGYAVQNDGRRYFAGPAFGAKAAAPTAALSVKNAVRPYMDELAAETGESVSLMIRVGLDVRFLSTVEGRHTSCVGDRRGAVLPAYKTAGGKAMLALLDEVSVARLFRAEEHTVDIAGLLRELSLIRRQGFAANVQSAERGICGVGVALQGHDGWVGALAVASPSKRFEAHVRNGLIGRVIGARNRIEADLFQHREVQLAASV
ncbi:IclR family transcriptional regulator [Georgenia sp. SYP-B2076]|uniref:IclR family transcriptional regulator n=1 Tax=Georgenia sp. SYP-B2076 TaxID=2495881 RepID=UPI000F8DC434|nr:IclR family transcriptional regulator [Georgenia sp. SYP-B2076]